MKGASANRPPRRFLGSLGSVGPAIIIASVVLGPGSILASSKVGWQHGYSMIWVLAGAVLLMLGMTALSARLGVVLDGTPCEELARRAGRPVAALAGATLFLVAACFQFGNNLGVLFALEPLLDGTRLEGSAAFSVAALALLNAAVVLALFGLRRLYRPLEVFLKVLVGVMVLAFAANLVRARPSIGGMFAGLVPRLPDEPLGEGLVTLAALVGTTFSVGGAFYQAYLVRQKGWTRADLGRGLFDAVAGILTLGLMTLMILATAAAVLHGNPAVTGLGSAADVARQLRPLFGPAATAIFSAGVFAGALSSFLVNAMIGGAVLSDGLGRGGSMDGRAPKLLTVLVLASGMGVASAVKAAGLEVGGLIVVAQSLTVIGNPLLAGSLLWLATRPDLRGERAIPFWMKAAALAGFAVVLALSVRTAYTLWVGG